MHQVQPEKSSKHNSRNLGPGDMEELSPELWEELRLDSAGTEYDLLGKIKQKKGPTELHNSLIEMQGYLRPLVLPLPGCRDSQNLFSRSGRHLP